MRPLVSRAGLLCPACSAHMRGERICVFDAKGASTAGNDCITLALRRHTHTPTTTDVPQLLFTVGTTRRVVARHTSSRRV